MRIAGGVPVRRAGAAVGLAVVLAAGPVGCSADGGGTARHGASGRTAADGPASGGGLKAVYRSAGSGQAGARDFLRSRGLAEEVARRLNSRIDLPRTVRLEARSCGASEVSYDQRARRVDVCYEFVDEVRGMFARANRPDVDARTAGVVRETLYHEAAHALVDQLDLPFVGREEDVADQFAAYQLVPQGARGANALLAAADNYALYARAADQDAPDAVEFTGAHTPDAARSANYLCYLYGSDPAAWSARLGARISAERSAQCEDEYRDLRRGWRRLLAPHTTGNR